MAAISRLISSASCASIASSTASRPQRGVKDWKYLLDFNEGCPNVAYLLDFLRRVREATPSGFDRILYIEQPTARDLQKDRANVMHEAARLRPVVIDESLTDFETLLLAREMGYTGVALKACKGQSHAMLMAAAAQKFGMFLCVQDLTCPGASLIHSAGIAARVPGNAGIEANARQFVPSANAAWEARFPGLFTIRDGSMNTGQLTGPGFGSGAATRNRAYGSCSVGARARVELRTKSRVWFERDDRDFEHSRLRQTAASRASRARAPRNQPPRAGRRRRYPRGARPAG